MGQAVVPPELQSPTDLLLFVIASETRQPSDVKEKETSPL